MAAGENRPLVGRAPRPTVRQVLGALPQIVRSLRPGPDRTRFPKDANQAMPEQVVGDLVFESEPAADADAGEVELFDTPQVRTDEQGREYQLVDADGQATFVPVDEQAGDTDEAAADVDDDGSEQVAS